MVLWPFLSCGFSIKYIHSLNTVHLYLELEVPVTIFLYPCLLVFESTLTAIYSDHKNTTEDSSRVRPGCAIRYEMLF